MAFPRSRLLLFLVPLLAMVVGDGLSGPSANAGPFLRRYQERQACEQFAGKLQAVSSNPEQAQFVYQQGVLKLVATFGENPCTDIPAPTATAPSTATSPAPAPAQVAKPGAAPVVAPVTAPSATPVAPAPAATSAPAAANPQQQQACQEFAAKLQGASGNPSQAQQIYAMGSQKLTGMFGANPCPQVKAP